MSVLLSEITDKNIPSVDKLIKALKYLNQGRELIIDGIRFKVAEHATGDAFGIIQVATSHNTSTKQDKEIVLGVPIEFFITKCSTLTEDQLTIMNADMVLHNIKNKS